MTHLLVQPRAGLLRALVCAGLVVGWFAAAVSAQPPSGPAPAGDQGALAAGAPPVADPVTIDLTTRRTALQADGSLDPELKSRVVDLYTRAIEERQKALDAAAENDALAQRIEDAPARIRALESAREAAPPESARLGTLTLEELTALARQKEQQLVEARKALTAEEKALATLTTQGPTLSGTVAQLGANLQSLQRDDHRSAPATEPPAATSAREAYRNAHEARVRAEFALAEQTIANYELLVRLATLQRDANALLVPRLDAEREALSKAIEEQRQEQARAGRTDALRAEIATADYPAAVSALAADNAKLREELEFVTRKSSEVAEQLRASQRKTGELEADLASILERVNTVGPTEAVGRLLRRQLHSLNVSGTDRLRARARAEEIVRATDQRIDLSEQRRELADVEARTKAVLDAVPEAERKAFDAATLEAETETLVKAKRATIEALQEAYSRYLTQLTSYDAAERQLAAGTNAMLAFIRKELVWIRSLPPMAATDFVETPRLLAEMVDPEAWRRVVTDAGNAAASNSLRAITLGLGLLLLIVLRPRLRRRLSDIVKLTGRMRTDAFRYTVQALLITLLIASALPLILTYAGWLAGAADDAGPFSVKISATLTRVGELLIIFSAARWVLHPDGLALNHFGWPNGLCVSLRRQMHWLALVALSCIAVAGYARQDASPTASLALGRPALLVFCAALVVFLWRLLRTDGPVVALMRARDPTRFAVRTWPVWCVLMVAVPVVLGIAAAVGYFYTAREALILLINTAWLVLGVHILRGVALRWFTVSERKLRLEQALKLREEARSERERQSRGEEGVVEALEIEVPKVDFRELGDQGRTVVHAAVVVGVLLSVWTLWADLLPALNILDGLDLPFTRLDMVDGVERQVPVTVTDLLVGLLVLGAALFAANNLEGLLGFTVLSRMNIDAGARYAITTLCQYALVTIGVLYMVSVIGLQWSKLQWLVAALGVGLGFGLQEIVANFVSGIILLLERPVRVGDIVTVGDATGTVARIRIRATTIIDWDRKELVVPNKEFITGRLLNWTLSNKIVRLIIPVGVAYGADPRKARELMLEVAQEMEHVLDDPKPLVVFSSFGDNALGLELRVYLSSMDHWLTTQTALHDAIYARFAQAGIGISFPQRDVHLDTSAPLDIRVQQVGEVSPTRSWRRGHERRR